LAAQCYETHRYTPALTAVGFFFLLAAAAGFVLRAAGMGGSAATAVGIAGLIGCNLVLLAISRVYVVRLQDRIIRLEMAVRCARLLTPAGQEALGGLPTPHIVALRFASDAELPGLLDRVRTERLTPDQIKRAIKDWQPDLART
jgi:hypothetical protein